MLNADFIVGISGVFAIVLICALIVVCGVAHRVVNGAGLSGALIVVYGIGLSIPLSGIIIKTFNIPSEKFILTIIFICLTVLTMVLNRVLKQKVKNGSIN